MKGEEDQTIMHMYICLAEFLEKNEKVPKMVCRINIQTLYLHLRTLSSSLKRRGEEILRRAMYR